MTTTVLQAGQSSGGEIYAGTGADGGKKVATDIDEHALKDVMARLTKRDATEVEQRTHRHRAYLTEGVVPQIAAGLLAAAEIRPADPFEFLARYLIR